MGSGLDHFDNSWPEAELFREDNIFLSPRNDRDLGPSKNHIRSPIKVIKA